MERKIVALITVKDERAFRENDGPIDHLVKEFERLGPSEIFLKDAFIADEDETEQWAAYLNYVAHWPFDHYGDEFTGMSPVSFEEFVNNEMEAEE